MQLVAKAAPRLLSLYSSVSFAQYLEQVEKDAMSKSSGQYDAANWLLPAEVSIFAADGCTEWDLPPVAEYKQDLTCRETFRGKTVWVLLTRVKSVP